MMDVLVSCCACGPRRRFTLGALDAATLTLWPVWGLFPAGQHEEIAGLAADRRFVYLAIRRPPALLLLDRDSFSVLRRHPLPGLDDLHSLCLRDEDLFVVSSGTDEVVCLRMRGPEIASQTVFWRPVAGAPRVDTHHLNGLCRVRGELHVSGFGPRRGGDWASAMGGFIHNVERDERVLSGIAQPHSVTELDDGLAYCESGRSMVHLPGRPPVCGLPGYTRGLCRAGDAVLVGTSLLRIVSRSTGKALRGRRRRVPAGGCSVSRISLRTGQVDLVADLSWHGGEIYDLLPLAALPRGPRDPVTTGGGAAAAVRDLSGTRRTAGG
jgi:hypothetical protein